MNLKSRMELQEAVEKLNAGGPGSGRHKDMGVVPKIAENWNRTLNDYRKSGAQEPRSPFENIIKQNHRPDLRSEDADESEY